MSGVTEAPQQTRKNEEHWRSALMGDVRGLNWTRAVMGHIPSEPRCKLCAAPFGRPGSMLVRWVGFGNSKINRRLCRGCIRHALKVPGGAEIDLSFLFADVRGSTALAERTPPQEFSQLMARFYGAAAKVVDRRDGIVDKFVGDEVVALFIPGFAGEDHASDAIAAARELMAETGNDGGEPWVPIGAAVHTGRAFVGVVGEGDAHDFTALGDPVNTTARLASDAGAGEILVTAAAAEAAQLDTAGLESRTLDLRGRDEHVVAWVAHAA
jgi:adenylate cyclase